VEKDKVKRQTFVNSLERDFGRSVEIKGYLKQTLEEAQNAVTEMKTQQEDC
jgi:hypothetical protein